jgi:hypothetical protein
LRRSPGDLILRDEFAKRRGSMSAPVKLEIFSDYV